MGAGAIHPALSSLTRRALCTWSSIQQILRFTGSESCDARRGEVLADVCACSSTESCRQRLIASGEDNTISDAGTILLEMIGTENTTFTACESLECEDFNQA
jgi:hypothetical protein